MTKQLNDYISLLLLPEQIRVGDLTRTRDKWVKIVKIDYAPDSDSYCLWLDNGHRTHVSNTETYVFQVPKDNERDTYNRLIEQIKLITD